MQTFKPLVGLFCGGLVGLACGFLAAIGLGMWSQWANPNDPSAGAVAIVVIVTAPVGACLGAVLGYFVIRKWPKVFLVTLLPASVLLLASYAREGTLRQMDRPRKFSLEVQGTSGAKFVGLVSVDGTVHRLEGTIPQKVEYEAMTVEIAVALPISTFTDEIAVRAFANGTEIGRGEESHSGVYLYLRSRGYSEEHGGTARTWSSMSDAEVSKLVKDGVMPSRDNSWMK